MGLPIDQIYGAMKHRETLFHFDPFRLTVVGVDSPEGDNVLADRDRVAHGFDEAKVQTIIELGIIQPVSFRKNGNRKDGSPNSEVVVGRDRVLSCREAWRRMRKAGVPEGDLPPVPAVLSRGEQEDLLAIQLIENMVRRPETPLSGARKAMRHYLLCKSKSKTALMCGVSLQTLEDWFKILELSPKVHKRIEAGEVSAHTALTLLRDVPIEDQEERIATAIAEGKAKGVAAEVEARRLRSDAPRIAVPGTDGSEAGAKSPSLPHRRALRRFGASLAEIPKSTNYSAAQVANLMNFVLDGEPLHGPLRKVWEAAEKAHDKGKKA